VKILSPADGWAVGFSCVPDCGTGVEHTLIQHWNGTTWSRVASADRHPGIEGLSSVSAVSASDAWAVGGYFTSAGNLDTLILHWNGTTWSAVPSPNPGGGFTYLAAVTAVSATDAWAAGYVCVRHCQLDSEVDHTLILHWNGTTWSQVASPNPGANYNVLSGVTAVSAADAWAVGGFFTRAGIFRTVMLHWNGTAWSRVASPNPGTDYSVLSGVTAVSATDAWAAGYFCARHCAQAIDHTLILHWNGTAWSQVASPNQGKGGNNLAAIGASSATNAWAVGNSCANACDSTPLILRWNGTTWSVR